LSDQVSQSSVREGGSADSQETDEPSMKASLRTCLTPNEVKAMLGLEPHSTCGFVAETAEVR
jgi:hypothetical protein